MSWQVGLQKLFDSLGRLLPIDGSQLLNINQFGNVVGSAPSYSCRAWVNFNGTGTPAIRGSGNVTSITDHATGDYTVNFTTAMPDVNYSVSGMAQRPHGSDQAGTAVAWATLAPHTSTLATTVNGVRIHTQDQSVILFDSNIVAVSIFR